MVTPSNITRLKAKGFVMAGAAPTMDELCAALSPSEWSVTRDVITPSYRGWCRKSDSDGDEESNVFSDVWFDNLLARLWLKLH